MPVLLLLLMLMRRYIHDDGGVMDVYVVLIRNRRVCMLYREYRILFLVLCCARASDMPRPISLQWCWMKCARHVSKTYSCHLYYVIMLTYITVGCYYVLCMVYGLYVYVHQYNVTFLHECHRAVWGDTFSTYRCRILMFFFLNVCLSLSLSFCYFGLTVGFLFVPNTKFVKMNDCMFNGRKYWAHWLAWTLNMANSYKFHLFNFAVSNNKISCRLCIFSRHLMHFYIGMFIFPKQSSGSIDVRCQKKKIIK